MMIHHIVQAATALRTLKRASISEKASFMRLSHGEPGVGELQLISLLFNW